ncbi:MAG: hypothetical protein Q4A05_10310 [Ruminococcus sp.]|nr:hypothetical protein [Ruminococcus sp.]
MELTVYRQASRTRPDGTIVYKGEDALPYADGQLIMVADGLGGAAAIRHSSIKPELFDEDKLADTLFSGVFDDYSSPVLLDYVKRSFFELRAVKDCYTDNVNNIKKSGYFASRIVTAIVLHELLCNEKLSAKELFSALGRETSQEKRGEMIAKVGTHFTELISQKLREIAKNANIFYESSYAGLSLLGTTLTAMLYRELGSETEVVLLTAGDSRPYVWTERDGLCQLTRDEERPDGGMTNYIKANDGEEFTISSRYMSFSRPCVIFAASDGCFDSGSFLSPLAFEKTILEAARDSVSPEDMSADLHDFFVGYGRHDDSSTIAMKLSGWSGFDEFKRAAERRLAEIDRLYTSQLTGLLEEDFISEYERSMGEAPDEMSLLIASLRESASVRAYCEEAVRDEAAALTENDEGIKNAAELRTSARSEVRRLAADIAADESDSGDLSGMVEAVKGFNAAKETYESMREEKFAANLRAAADRYWTENAAALITDIKDGKGSCPAELAAEIKSAADALSEKLASLGSNAQKQRALFDSYDAGYTKYIGGEQA